jgi:hypothetical protein
MKKLAPGDLVLTVLGLLLLTAAVLKGHELLTVPVASEGLWSWRPFLIFQVEFELALGIWLLSGLFKSLAWLAGLGCFSLFCCVTLYKGLTGATSCGCFGSVHVDPWITLAAIDLPALALLLVFRPPGIWSTYHRSYLLSVRILRLSQRACQRRARLSSTHLGSILRSSLGGLMSGRLAATVCISTTALCVTTPVLALNKPAMATTKYEVLEPETWVGKELPILPYVDIGEQLATGNWLLVLYHYDCPDCSRAIPMYEQMARDMEGNEDVLRIALVEVPPYGQSLVSRDSPCVLGRLTDVKEWFVTTPAIVLLTNGQIMSAWQEEWPDLGQLLGNMATGVK